MDVKALPDINTPRSPLLPTKEYLQSLAIDKANRGATDVQPAPGGDAASASRAAARVERPMYIGDGPPPVSPNYTHEEDAGAGARAGAGAGAASGAGVGAGGSPAVAPAPAAGGVTVGRASPSVDPDAWVRQQLRNPTVEQIRQYWIDRQVRATLTVSLTVVTTPLATLTHDVGLVRTRRWR